MTLTIDPADFADSHLADFLQAHLDDLAPTAPAESQHAFDLSALQRPSVRMWIVRDAGEIIATGALVALKPGHEELKSMRTDPRYRGRGVARGLVEHLLADARARGVSQIFLETGSMQFFAPARSLYASCGFVECGPFGDYGEDPNSTFMSRAV